MTTLTEHRADTIEHLDFRPTCTCESGYCTHPEGVQCEAEADVILTFHQLHGCNDGDTDAYGNEVGQVCACCLERLTAVVAEHVERLRDAARRCGGVAVCHSCGAPVMHVSDVIRDVRPLR